MIAREARELLSALPSCDRKARVKRLQALVARSGDACLYEFGIPSSASSGLIEVRFYPRSRSHLGALPGAVRTMPPGGFPAVSLSWDTRADAEARLQTYEESASLGGRGCALRRERGSAVLLKPVRWTGSYAADAALREALPLGDPALRIKDLVAEWEVRPRAVLSATAAWWLRLARGIPWPQFLGRSLAKPFEERAAPLSFLLLDLRVATLRFAPAGATAYLRSSGNQAQAS